MPTFQLRDATSGVLGEFVLRKSITSIGSSPDNDIVIIGAAEHHAFVHCDASAFQIQAADRAHDLLINGKKKKKETLRHLDEVSLGSARLVFSLLDTSQPREQAGASKEEIAHLDSYRRLHDFSRKLLAEYELGSLINSLMDAVIAITNADKGFLILSENDEFKVKVARNVNEEDLANAVDQVSDAVVAKVVQSRKALIVNDALNDAEFNSSQSVINLNLCSVMCVPLLDRGSLLGLIYVGNGNVTSLFTERHLELLTVFAAQASLIVANAIMINELKLDNQALNRKLSGMRFGSIIGACDAIKDVFRTVERVAPTSVNVLIVGETGTGKELIAHELHARSPRAKGPFITLNCGAIPENLLESELFGHVKGAFTGATSNREGSFQAADGGTIFLDEIGEMPINLQVKLLRVLQEHTITKVGSTKLEKVDIRVVAATNKDLELAVRNHEFREDLFYRLNVVMLRLPPLRDRGDDVVVIAQFLIKKICDEFNLPLKQLGADAVIAMKKYEWPGNIRQLENRLKKAIVLANRSVLNPDDLDLPPEVLRDIVPLADAKEHFAHRYILEALERNGGNRTQTARELDVDPRTIFRYLEKT
ncbi:MAG: sigma 54-interacting transcriptional regulator [Bradymonadaceae bacterium]|nr:sigma 54-interacting transcriptional regulator [Lujinxingiaceae bacterium]